MKFLTAKKEYGGITCEDIGFFYQEHTTWPSFDIKIFAKRNQIKGGLPDCETASVDGKADYLLLFANFRKKAEEFETIRRSNKTVIVICGEDFNFIEDVEQYVAAGAVVMAINKLRSYNG